MQNTKIEDLVSKMSESDFELLMLQCEHIKTLQNTIESLILISIDLENHNKLQISNTFYNNEEFLLITNGIDSELTEMLKLNDSTITNDEWITNLTFFFYMSIDFANLEINKLLSKYNII